MKNPTFTEGPTFHAEIMGVCTMPGFTLSSRQESTMSTVGFYPSIILEMGKNYPTLITIYNYNNCYYYSCCGSEWLAR